jgi:hypothetical protein
VIVTAKELNVRSGPGTDFRVLGQLFLADAVQVLETRGEWVYVTPVNGWAHRAYLRPEDRLTVPVGALGIIQMFGEPGAPECSAGRVKLPAPVKLGWQNASVTVVACHSRMEETFERAFRRIYDIGYWRMIETFDGIYNKRETRLGGKISSHSWGIAVDLNAKTNAQGTRGRMPQELVTIFEDEGFEWGGRWSGRSMDPMHFQYATGY